MSKFSLINYLQDMEYWDMKWGYKSPQLWVQAYKRKLMPEFIPSSFRSTFFSWTFSHPVVKSAARWHMANFPHMLWVSHACMGNFDITLTRHDWINYFLISALENILSILPTFVCVLFFFSNSRETKQRMLSTSSSFSGVHQMPYVSHNNIF